MDQITELVKGMSLDDISRNSTVVRMEDIGEDQLGHGHMVHDEDRTDPRHKTSQHSRGNGDLSEERGEWANMVRFQF